MQSPGATLASPPRPHRWRRRLLYLAILLTLAVAGWLTLPWIFMPADLRAMQGTWKIVASLVEDQPAPPSRESGVVIHGHRLFIVDDQGERLEAYMVDVDPDAHSLVIHKQE